MATEVVIPDTFPGLLLQQSSQRGASPAIRRKSRGIWHTTNWTEFANETAVLAAALAARGLKRGGHLAVLGDNCPRLVIAISAAHWLGATAAPFSRDATAAELAQPFQRLGISHVFAEDQEQVDKVLAILPQCAGIQCVFYDNDRGMRQYRQPQLASYAALLQSGRSAARIDGQSQAGDTAFILHGGNGTETLSHETLIGKARASVLQEGVDHKDIVVACLSPTIVEQILFSYARPLIVGHCVCYPESSDTLLSDMREIAPSRLLAPVGALKALQETASERMEDAGALKRGLYQSQMKAQASALGKLLVQAPLRDVLGVGRLDAAQVAGTPDAATSAFFSALGIELKAMPETDAAAGANTATASIVDTYQGAAPARAFPIGQPILELDNISLRFGGVNALTDISFKVREHEVLAIIGPNGAGKSSMLNVINGVYRPQEGRITLRGEKVNGMTPTRAAHMGISRTFQNIALFKGMSVLDNIMAGRTLKMHANFVEVALQLPRARREESEHRQVVEEIIEFLEIEHIRKTPVARLPYGLQKRVELGRALAAEPKILLLDEPMAGMNIEEKQDMSRFVLDVNDHYGTTVVLIEHDMGVVMDISDRVVVLDYGKKIGDGTPDEVRANQDVIDAYLGVAH